MFVYSKITVMASGGASSSAGFMGYLRLKELPHRLAFKERLDISTSLTSIQYDLR
jgi:hypothetical protein